MPTVAELYENYVRNPELLFSDSDEAVVINEFDVEKSATRHAESYLHWARMNAIAQSERKNIDKHIRESVLPACKVAARQQLAATNEKATEGRIEELAFLDPAYQEAAARLANAEKLAAHFDRIESAMWQRKDMIQTVNARQCKEIGVMSPDANFNRNFEQNREYVRNMMKNRENPNAS